ncbi:ABC transporter [Kitasatospora sp. LaBMicrA B282]|uniref:ABC transporter n=1 Tax=Kitasatospora sp. LaBMicrA B282 TaxID=3420949 RepID=UPI003D0F29D8
MSALVRYQAALLLRSQRWLPPLLCFVLVLGIGVAGDEPLMDSLAFGGALLVPITAWYVRCTLTADPPQARACLVAAVGAARVQLASLVVALGVGLVLAGATVGACWAVCGRTVADPTRSVPRGEALLAGVPVVLSCVLTGLVVGALSHRPVLLRGSYGILAVLGLSMLMLLLPGVPANSAVRALETGSQQVRVSYPLLAPLLAALLAVVVAAGTAALAGRRTE